MRADSTHRFLTRFHELPSAVVVGRKRDFGEQISILRLQPRQRRHLYEDCGKVHVLR